MKKKPDVLKSIDKNCFCMLYFDFFLVAIALLLAITKLKNF